MIYFENNKLERKTHAFFTWSYLSEVQYEVFVEIVDNLLEVTVVLPFETDLNDRLLLKGAETVVEQDSFTDGFNNYAYTLSYDGSDPDYSYTLEEIVDEIWPDKELVRDRIVGDQVVYTLRSRKRAYE